MKKLIAILVLVVGCDSSGPTSGQAGSECSENSQCDSGAVCISGKCTELCTSDLDCADGFACSASVCMVCDNCRDIPEVSSVNGTGSVDAVNGGNHVLASLQLTGFNLEGVRVGLTGGSYSDVELAPCGASSANTIDVALPTDFVPGSYTLRVSNQAGACSVDASILQGEKGDPGSYVVSTGLVQSGDNLSVDFGTGNAQAARGDHGHSDIAATASAELAALASTLDGIKRDCAVIGTQTYNAVTGSWSACPTTWDCTTQADLPGCVQSSKFADCKAIADAGYTGPNGLFWMDLDGPAAGTEDPFRAYCEMQTDGGGWTMAINLNTSDATRQDYFASFWTTPGTFGSPADALTLDHKSAAFEFMPAAEIMMVAHNQGAVMGTASYTLLNVAAGQTLLEMFVGLSDQTVSDLRRSSTGAVGTGGRTRNDGEGFIDHNYPLIINSRYSPVDSDNYTRLGTNYSSSCPTIDCNGHNFGGWGGRHVRSGWGASYEGAALNGYCNAQGAFGSNGTGYAGNDAFGGGACTGASASMDVDLAVFVR